MKAIKFVEHIIIDRQAEAVFDFTQDYNTRLAWDTFLKKADLIDGATRADKGVKAYCVANNGLGMVTEYITYNRPKVTAIKMTKGPYLFRSFSASWTFNDTVGNKTEVSFVYSFTLRFPFDLFAGFIKNNLQRNVRQRLVDLKTTMDRK